MTVLNSLYDVWKITSKPEWYLENNLPFRMTVLYSPNDIWKITSKPEWYLENNYTMNDSSQFTLWYLKNNLKPKWYLENNYTSESQFSIHFMMFEK